jgi:predicted phage-related endonuclease
MLGLSKKVKRNELLQMKHTGLAREFSDWVQTNILDYGHEVEAQARPLVEVVIGDDLYPVTCSDGTLSASCDGLTMDEKTAFEHKQWNAVLAASVEAGELPEEHMPQCQQILMVTGAEKVVFTVSDGTEAQMVYMYVRPDLTWFERIRAGWEQFAKDLAEYAPRELAERPTAEPIMQLPALKLQIRGEVVMSNLPDFKRRAEEFISNIKTDLVTDEDFANADETVKFCQAAEDTLEKAKAAAIAQTESVDLIMRTIDHISEQLRTKRLALAAMVKSKKESIKLGILNGGKDKFAEHVAALEKETFPVHLGIQQPDFAGAMKNKRTLASLHDAVDTTLATAKIAADTTARAARTNQTWFKENAGEYVFLFNDMQQIVFKATDDFQMLVNTRVDTHKKAEADRLEAERVRIQEQERVKAEEKVRAETAAKQLAETVVTAAETKSATEGPASNRSAAPQFNSTQAWPFPAKTAPSAQKASRPTDAEMIAVLALHYRSHESKVIEWLLNMDLEQAGKELAEAM